MILRQGDLFGARKEKTRDPLALDIVLEPCEIDDDDGLDVPQLYAYRTPAPHKPGPDTAA